MKTFNKYIIALLAIFAFAPVALAAGDGEDTGVVLNKTVRPTGGYGYELTLETYATGSSVTKEIVTTKATDFVLVLDTSESMDATHAYTTTASYWTPVNGTLADLDMTVLADNEKEVSVQAKVGGNTRQLRCNNGTWQYKSGSSWNNIGSNTVSDIKVKKFFAMKMAATKFVDTVVANNNESNAGKPDNEKIYHRISVVSYNGSGSLNSTLVPVYNNNTNVTSLKNSIKGLSTAYYTRTDYGLERAAYQFSTHPDTATDQRARVVIVLTDGEPTSSGQTLQWPVANAAAYVAGICKSTYKAKVFSVGIYATAPASDSNVYKFLDNISSNFPDGTATPTGTITGNVWGTDGADKNLTGSFGSSNSLKGTRSSTEYYVNVTSADALSGVFETIATTAAEGGATAELHSESTVKDYLAPWFSLPEGTDENDIKVYLSHCIGKDSWDEPVLYEDAKININSASKLINVSGFDYTKGDEIVNGNTVTGNWVGSRDITVNNKVTGSRYDGYKLIIKIPVEVSPDCPGGADIPTNTAESGIYDDSGDPVAPYPVPAIDLPVPVTIEKIGLDEGDSAVFSINFKSMIPTSYAVHFPGDYVTSVVLIGKGPGVDNKVSTTIWLEPAVYSIKEESAWSQGYTPSSSNPAVEQTVDEPMTLTYTNIKGNPTPEDAVLNKFKTETKKRVVTE